MVRSLQEMAAKGQRKLAAKGATMGASYNAAKPRMKSNYAALPFGPRMKAKYNAGVDAGVYHAPDAAKWAKNWIAKVSE